MDPTGTAFGGGLTTLHSAGGDRDEGDESDMINAFFLPGGILDPDDDDDGDSPEEAPGSILAASNPPAGESSSSSFFLPPSRSAELSSWATTSVSVPPPHLSSQPSPVSLTESQFINSSPAIHTHDVSGSLFANPPLPSAGLGLSSQVDSGTPSLQNAWLQGRPPSLLGEATMSPHRDPQMESSPDLLQASLHASPLHELSGDKYYESTPFTATAPPGSNTVPSVSSPVGSNIDSTMPRHDLGAITSEHNRPEMGRKRHTKAPRVDLPATPPPPLAVRQPPPGFADLPEPLQSNTSRQTPPLPVLPSKSVPALIRSPRPAQQNGKKRHSDKNDSSWGRSKVHEQKDAKHSNQESATTADPLRETVSAITKAPSVDKPNVILPNQSSPVQSTASPQHTQVEMDESSSSVSDHVTSVIDNQASAIYQHASKENSGETVRKAGPNAVSSKRKKNLNSRSRAYSAESYMNEKAIINGTTKTETTNETENENASIVSSASMPRALESLAVAARWVEDILLPAIQQTFLSAYSTLSCIARAGHIVGMIHFHICDCALYDLESFHWHEVLGLIFFQKPHLSHSLMAYFSLPHYTPHLLAWSVMFVLCEPHKVRTRSWTVADAVCFFGLPVRQRSMVRPASEFSQYVCGIMLRLLQISLPMIMLLFDTEQTTLMRLTVGERIQLFFLLRVLREFLLFHPLAWLSFALQYFLVWLFSFVAPSLELVGVLSTMAVGMASIHTAREWQSKDNDNPRGSRNQSSLN